MIDPEVIAHIAERKIQEAIDEGKFDNLPGKGQPIVFEDDPGVPLHIRMANKVLKNAGGLPDWMMLQRDIVHETQEAHAQRARLIREAQSRLVRLRTLPVTHPDIARYMEWHARQRAAYLRRLKNINTSILKFSMSAPSTCPAYPSYKIDREMEAFDREFSVFTASDGTSAPAADASKDEESRLRRLARERYSQGGGEVRGWAKAAGLLGLGRAPRKPAQEGGGYAGASDLDRENIGRKDVPDAEG